MELVVAEDASHVLSGAPILDLGTYFVGVRARGDGWRYSSSTLLVLRAGKMRRLWSGVDVGAEANLDVGHSSRHIKEVRPMSEPQSIKSSVTPTLLARTSISEHHTLEVVQFEGV